LAFLTEDVDVFGRVGLALFHRKWWLTLLIEDHFMVFVFWTL
jgi:hypothetical protein